MMQTSTIRRSAHAASLVVLLAACSGVAGREAQPTTAGAVEVRVQSDEAEAALAILATLASAEEVEEAAWNELFTTEGYRRLERREHAMGREFEQDEFRAFLADPETLRRRAALARTLEGWQGIDATAAAARAHAYLPRGTALRATLYPVIKPRTNSFVFDLATDSAAIFLYLDPDVTPAQFENTLAHELHHVGYAAACAAAPQPDAATGVGLATVWLGAFGEGLAMLAAAGGPEAHPHAVSPREDRERWDRDVLDAAADMAEVEEFLLSVAEGRLSDEQAVQERAMSFFGVQGPWYTVGWVMAATVERELGRDRLVENVCDRVRLLADYNEAAARANARDGAMLPTWNPALIRLLGASSAGP